MLPLIKPRSIDDVPILALTLWSRVYDSYMLRRIAAQLHDEIKSVNGVAEVGLIGGQQRRIHVRLNQAQLAAYRLTAGAVIKILQDSNQQLPAGSFAAADQELLIESGLLFSSRDAIERMVVHVHDGRAVYLRDVAQIVDGPAEPTDYIFFVPGHAFSGSTEGVRDGSMAHTALDSFYSAVTISIAKRKGANAITVADQVLAQVNQARGRLIPREVEVSVTRNYGHTAQEKSNELLWHMALAVISVSLLIGWFLGARDSGVVALAIPVTLALTLVVFYFFGYTLNRVTLFALIFSIGILVDDAIVVLENVTRHYQLSENRGRNLAAIILEAVDEVGNPTVLATFTVIAAILPVAFVSGLMGPYMRPIPIGASAAMTFSLLTAFMVTPWAALKLFGSSRQASHAAADESRGTRLYRKVMGSLIGSRKRAALFLGSIVVLLLMAISLFWFKIIVVKMLPFDNKSEFQVIIDMPEGTTLERTAAVAGEMALYLQKVPEVSDLQIYAGTASPYNFNGLVRHYFLRRGPHVADIQVNLAPKEQRGLQSHDIARKVRPTLQAIAARHHANIKVAEVPPGPPVLQTLVAEVYGPDYSRQIEVARYIRRTFEQTEGVVDVDWYVEDDSSKVRLVVDQQKAALHGISSSEVAQTIATAVDGHPVGLLHDPREKEDVPIVVRFPREERSRLQSLKEIQLTGLTGKQVPLVNWFLLSARWRTRAFTTKTCCRWCT